MKFLGTVSASALVLAATLITGSLNAQVTLNLPPRPADAPTGSAFYQQVLSMTNAQREALAWQEVVRGNVPNFLRTLVPITVTATINSQTTTAVYHVTPDYFAIGSDADFFRLPMSATLAQQIADLLDCNLPTRKMVNDIYTASTVKLAPFPYNPANYDIDSIQVMYLSQQKIEEQRLAAGGALGALIGGTKKDVVVTDELDNRPAPPRVAIYGWHQLNGSPIQPLSLVHEQSYHDYSHGIRLVAQAMTVNGVANRVESVIQNATLTRLLNDEANAYTTTRYPVPPPPGLLGNPSFEDFPTSSGAAPSWTAWSAPGSAAINYGRAGLNKVDGNYSQYWSRTGNSPYDGGVYQRVNTTPGAVYRLRGWMKRQTTYGGLFVGIGYDTSGGTAGAATSVVYHNVASQTNDVWHQTDLMFTATGSQTTIFTRGAHNGTGTSTNPYFYVDAITFEIIPDSQVPRPTTFVSY